MPLHSFLTGTGSELSAVYGVVIFLFAVFSFVFVLRHMKIRTKVRRLAELMDQESGNTPEKSLAAIEMVASRLTMMDRDHHLIRIMKDDSRVLTPILKELTHHGVYFDKEGFIVVAFNACRLQTMTPPRHFRTRDRLMRELIEKSLPAGSNAYVLDMEDMYVCLFNVEYEKGSAKEETIKKEAEEFANIVIDKVSKTFEICTTASVSELHQGVTSLKAAYQEVQGLFEYRSITENPAPVIHHNDYYVSFDSWYKFGNTYHKFEEVRRLVTSIHVGDFTNARLLVNDLISNDYSRLYPSLVLARCRLFGLIDAGINAMGLLKGDLDHEFLEELDPSTRIVNCKSYSDLLREFDSIFTSIIDYYAGKKKESPPEWFETILQYIDRHYNDVNINVATIAEHFDISSAYYARVFKKIMGISPLDYIHKLRMRSAKRLMSKGVSVKDAASIVGYGNPITMSRAFKRYEGVTPGSYIKH